jgi:hypothetical protein
MADGLQLGRREEIACKRRPVRLLAVEFKGQQEEYAYLRYKTEATGLPTLVLDALPLSPEYNDMLSSQLLA